MSALLPETTSVFLISLERESQHRTAVFDELKKLQLGPIQVVNAFDGKARLEFDSPRLSPFLGTLGCLISHLMIYLNCHQKGIERALIFEDDAKVVDEQIARQAIRDGEGAGVDICCYCSQSTDNRFLNCHAYSMSLLAMQTNLSMLDSILQSPLNIHIDVLIEHCRRMFGLSYRSLGHSTIVQDKELPFTIKWGGPEFVSAEELQFVKRMLVSTPLEISKTIA